MNNGLNYLKYHFKYQLVLKFKMLQKIKMMKVKMDYYMNSIINFYPYKIYKGSQSSFTKVLSLQFILELLHIFNN